MLDPLKFRLYSLGNYAKTCLQQLKTFRGSKHRRRFSKSHCGFKPSFEAIELSNQPERVFKFIDANGDGKIPLFELSEVLLRLGHDKSVVVYEESC
ncbi:hypothetical protein Nepgr_002417 [Nepenthes gracilis]|uniref:EF-hand domain-containing protein n=1 Tax=Nepenthes gracilis TaxID=150966 RepID=A0AAD3P8S5_NEPGR|nr:hypothetical protein Nepgr_002417 [Nepenthes gracilis]